MNKVKYRLTLDLQKHGIQHTIYAKRGDALSREVIFTLRDGGRPYALTSDLRAFMYVRSDEAEIFTECEIAGGNITAPLTTNMLAANDITIELRLTNPDGAILTAGQVKVISEDVIYSENAMTASNEYSTLLQAINAAEASRITHITAEGTVITIRYADGNEVGVTLTVDTGVGILTVDFVESNNSSEPNILKITMADGVTYEFNVKNGKSAYDYAREQGYKGTEEEFAETIAALARYKIEPWTLTLDDDTPVTKNMVVS